MAFILNNMPVPHLSLCLVSYCSTLKIHLGHDVFQEPALNPLPRHPRLCQVPLLRWAQLH